MILQRLRLFVFYNMKRAFVCTVNNTLSIFYNMKNKKIHLFTQVLVCFTEFKKKEIKYSKLVSNEKLSFCVNLN